MAETHRKFIIPALAILVGPVLWLSAKFARYWYGCPMSGECYNDGWVVHNNLEMFFILWLVVIFPAMLARIFILSFR